MIRSLARREARKRPRMLLALLAAAAAAAVLAACSSGTSSSGSNGSSPAAAAASGTLNPAKIGSATVLTNAKGFTLYSFAPDTSTKSNCNGSCVTYWPPVKGAATCIRSQGHVRHDQTV